MPAFFVLWKAVHDTPLVQVEVKIKDLQERDVPGSCAGIVGPGSNEGSGAGCCPTLQSARLRGVNISEISMAARGSMRRQ